MDRRRRRIGCEWCVPGPGADRMYTAALSNSVARWDHTRRGTGNRCEAADLTLSPRELKRGFEGLLRTPSFQNSSPARSSAPTVGICVARECCITWWYIRAVGFHRFPRVKSPNVKRARSKFRAEPPRSTRRGRGARPWSSCERTSKASTTFMVAPMASVDGGCMHLDGTALKNT
jgi:hypothetical protein